MIVSLLGPWSGPADTDRGVGVGGAKKKNHPITHLGPAAVSESISTVHRLALRAVLPSCQRALHQVTRTPLNQASVRHSRLLHLSGEDLSMDVRFSYPCCPNHRRTIDIDQSSLVVIVRCSLFQPRQKPSEDHL